MAHQKTIAASHAAVGSPIFSAGTMLSVRSIASVIRPGAWDHWVVGTPIGDSVTLCSFRILEDENALGH